MLDRQACETILLDELEWVHQAMAAVCRRYGSSAADIDDFASWATLKLIENDYHVLRQFRGESSVRTYLVVVIAMMHREYRARSWGRWRASAAAKRGGAIAMHLERLVQRDGMSLRQATTLLRMRGETTMTDREMAALYRTLPMRRSAFAHETVRCTTDAAEPTTADERVVHAECDEERHRVQSALERALSHLPLPDQRVLRMRFWEGLGIADIARRLEVAQKPLYRRVERALGTLRKELERQGLSRSVLASMGDRAA